MAAFAAQGLETIAIPLGWALSFSASHSAILLKSIARVIARSAEFVAYKMFHTLQNISRPIGRVFDACRIEEAVKVTGIAVWRATTCLDAGEVRDASEESYINIKRRALQLLRDEKAKQNVNHASPQDTSL